LRRVMDVVSKPCTWNRSAAAVSHETQPVFQLIGLGRTTILSVPTPTRTSAAFKLDSPVPSVYAIYKFSNTGQ